MTKYVAVIDIGTVGVRILVSEVTDANTMHIIAKVSVPCKGIKNFAIEDEIEVTEAIKRAVRKVREQTEIQIKSSYVGIPGKFTSFVASSAEMSIESQDGDSAGEITYSHIGELFNRAADIEIYEDEGLLDVYPVRFTVGDETYDKPPIGLQADSLKVDVAVVIGNNDYIRSVTSCLKNAGVDTDNFIPYSVSLPSVLPDEDDESFNMLHIDIGGSQTDFTVYNKKIPYFASSLPVGGMQITNDIAYVEKLSTQEAENIKRDYHIACVDVVTNNVDVAVYSEEKNAQCVVKVADIVEIMQARIEDIFYNIQDVLEKENMKYDCFDRILLTGDGIVNFSGLDKLCENIFHSQIWNVDLTRTTGMKSTYTYASAMVKYMSECLRFERMDSNVEKVKTASSTGAVSADKKSVKGSQKSSGVLEKLSKWWNKVKE